LRGGGGASASGSASGSNSGSNSGSLGGGVSPDMEMTMDMDMAMEMGVVEYDDDGFAPIDESVPVSSQAIDADNSLR
jgi:hypothetical protein